MLAAFPPPGLATPNESERNTKHLSSWPSPYQPSRSPLRSAYNEPDSQPKPRRRCCGLPACWFVLLLILLLCLIAAAVVIPLQLLVFNRPNNSNNNNSNTSSLTLATCQQTTTCANSGTVTLLNSQCACICPTDFTGPTCATTAPTSCTTTSLGPSLPTATLGSALPRLLTSAALNFSIPLTPSLLLPKLAAASLSCDAQNALVTFSGASANVRAAAVSVDPLTPFVASTQALDFARVAVLYVLEQRSVDEAVAAQGLLQRFLNVPGTTVGEARNVSVARGGTADLDGFRVDLGRGLVGVGVGVGV